MINSGFFAGWVFFMAIEKDCAAERGNIHRFWVFGYGMQRKQFKLDH
jgi:hypothetical protein